jgi:hypothetical protein
MLPVTALARAVVDIVDIYIVLISESTIKWLSSVCQWYGWSTGIAE